MKRAQPPIPLILDVLVFAALAEDLGHAGAMSFLVMFNSLLPRRIHRIRQAFTTRDREEILTAMLSLQASAAMAGAAQLHETTTRALMADPIEDHPPEPLIEQLTSEAQDFTRAFRPFEKDPVFPRTDR